MRHARAGRTRLARKGHRLHRPQRQGADPPTPTPSSVPESGKRPAIAPTSRSAEMRSIPSFLLGFASVVGLGLMAIPRAATAEMYDAEYRACSGGSTVAIVDCLSAKSRAWDARLNAAYRAALQRVDRPQREPLRKVQRLWIQYRDANCLVYGAREGSLREIEAAECVRSLTADR